MEYEVQLIPVNKSPINSRGLAMPLCNDCQTPDCTNPIRERSMSVRGIVIKMRLWAANNVIRQVVACNGYVSSVDVTERDDEEMEEEK